LIDAHATLYFFYGIVLFSVKLLTVNEGMKNENWKNSCLPRGTNAPSPYNQDFTWIRRRKWFDYDVSMWIHKYHKLLTEAQLCLVCSSCRSLFGSFKWPFSSLILSIFVLLCVFEHERFLQANRRPDYSGLHSLTFLKLLSLCTIVSMICDYWPWFLDIRDEW